MEKCEETIVGERNQGDMIWEKEDILSCQLSALIAIETFDELNYIFFKIITQLRYRSQTDVRNVHSSVNGETHISFLIVLVM